MAVQMLYQKDLGGGDVGEIFMRFRPMEYSSGAGSEAEVVEEAFVRAKGLVEGTLANLEAIDALIAAQADNWRLERMPAVDRNILRLAVFEFQHQEDVPKLVVIDEAIELAKRFGSENSSSFVNGVLDGLLKSHTFPGTLT
jgi:N utilization substance protein B